jgi:hypothetical protein
VLASPLLYSGRQRRLRATIFAHPSEHSELRSIYLCSSLILLYPAIKFSHNRWERWPPESHADGMQQLSSCARAPEGQDLEPSEAGLVPTEEGQNRLRLCRGCCFSSYTAKVAITRWLHLHQKEGLYQEEYITARI